jgi:hypothetical protein
VFNKVRSINKGKFVLSESVNEKSMVMTRDGYDRFSADYFGTGKVMKVLKNLKVAGFTIANCTALYHAIATGGVAQDGSITPSNVKEGKVAGSLYGDDSVSVSVQPGQDTFSAPSLTASDIVSPRRRIRRSP